MPVFNTIYKVQAQTCFVKPGFVGDLWPPAEGYFLQPLLVVLRNCGPCVSQSSYFSKESWKPTF
jgi:hypothetical protein